MEEFSTIDKQVSVDALRLSTKNTICSMLNPKKVLQTEKKIYRDWRGLLVLCGLDKVHDYHMITQNKNPTGEILKLWRISKKDECTVERLLGFFEQMDRFDIIDDIKAFIIEDIKLYNNPSKLEAELQQEDADCYDAFVLYVDEDIGFASDLLNVLENEYNLKLYAHNRDMEPGKLVIDATVELINKRCRRLIVILSDSFFNSPTEKFFLSLACDIGIKERSRKIIPITYKACANIPPDLSCYFILDYRRANTYYNFWETLRKAIVAPDKKLIQTNQKIVPVVVNPPQHCLKSALHHESDHSCGKALNHHVKFTSMVNLNTTENVLSEPSLSASNSANSLGVCSESGQKKVKNKNFFHRLINNSSKKGDSSIEKSIEALPDPPSADVVVSKKKNIFTRFGLTKNKNKMVASVS